MTPLYCTLLFPLSELQQADLRASGWIEGPLPIGHGEQNRIARLGLQDGVGPVARLLGEDDRWHREFDEREGSLSIVAADAVMVRARWSSIVGYLILHVEAGSGAPETSVLNELGELARPETQFSQSVLAAIAGESPPWGLGDARRVPTIALTAQPNDEEAGLVRWPGSSALDRRLVSLVVLRHGESEVLYDPGIPVVQPTPSYVVRSSMTSTAIGRLRTVEKKHVQRLRTYWTDVLLIELTQRDALTALSAQVRRRADMSDRAGWPDLRDEFRNWRTTSEWRPEADRPLEQGLASAVRAGLGTPELIERVERELKDHADAYLVRTERDMSRAVGLLAVAAAVVPLLLQLSQEGRQNSVDGFFVAAALVSTAVGALVLMSLRK